MKDPCIFNPRAPEPRFSDPSYEPDFGPPLNDLELRDRLRDPNTFLFTRQSGEPKTITIVAQAPASLVHYFVLSISREAKASRRFDVSGFSDDAVKLAVAWMMAGGRPSVQSLTPRDMPLDALICLVRQVLDLASKLRIMALSWKAGEFLDGISKGEGLSDRSFRKKISGELEARYKRNRAEYVGRIKEKNKDDLEEAATNAGVLGCLGGCLGLFTSFDD